MNAGAKTQRKQRRTVQVFDDYLQFEFIRGADDRLSLQFEFDKCGIFCRIVWLATEGMTHQECEAIVQRVKRSLLGMTRAEVEDYVARSLRKTVDICDRRGNQQRARLFGRR